MGILLANIAAALPVLLASWAIARWATGWSIAFAHRTQLLATANERSSHRDPTPRIGGIGLGAGMAVAFAVLAAMAALGDRMPFPALRPVEGAVTWRLIAAMGTPTLLAFALGLWDDRSNPPAWAKLLGQILIAAIPPSLGLRIAHIHLPPMAEVATLSPAAGWLLTFAWILLVMNAVNFMDGINGLAGRFAQNVGVFAVVAVFGLRGSESVLPMGMAMVGAAAGFLHYNIPKARTFMGDCGSQPLGVFASLLGVHIATLPTTYPIPIAGFALIVSLFLFDVLFTLAKRTIAGENPMKAHRQHLYQRHLRATGEDHGRTLDMAETYLFITGICGAVYCHQFFASQSVAGQATCLAVAAAALGHYWWTAVSAERAKA